MKREDIEEGQERDGRTMSTYYGTERKRDPPTLQGNWEEAAQDRQSWRRMVVRGFGPPWSATTSK